MQKTPPAIMVQGTCSNAGKSLLVAALCRIFAEDGLNPAPFKAQNMALNSFVTDEGGEIGRAQALQAAAAGRAPDTRMNPVLLKPNSDTGSQVIIGGQPVGNMRVKEYLAYKPVAWQAVTAAYDSLATEAGVMVIEGAGSPAEINLQAHDIVNMAMARYAKAPVLLCTDIDRGGAFASLVGTMALLEPADQDRIAGFILNKFRGDPSLLHSALTITTEKTGKPFLGTVPWLPDLNLPEEDSVSFRLYGSTPPPPPDSQLLDVALLDLPHASNITDVDALRVEGDVRLRIVRRPEELGQPHCLIIPGSKNTPGDLRYLEQSGLASAIMRLTQGSAPLCILGICGGLQILGSVIHDPLGLENGTPCTLSGLGLLPLATELLPQKTLCRCTAQHKPSGLAIEGYEIHHGETRLTATHGATGEPQTEAVIYSSGQHSQALGWQAQHKQSTVIGTYVHGVLDSDAFRRHFLNNMRIALGWQAIERTSPYSLAPGLDKLARAVRESLDMKKIYELMGI